MNLKFQKIIKIQKGISEILYQLELQFCRWILIENGTDCKKRVVFACNFSFIE